MAGSLGLVSRIDSLRHHHAPMIRASVLCLMSLPTSKSRSQFVIEYVVHIFFCVLGDDEKQRTRKGLSIPLGDGLGYCMGHHAKNRSDVI
jgi:hypothetical protein